MSHPQTKDVLIAARKLIDAPEKWTKGKFAVDASGATVCPTDEYAVCFCGHGACIRVAGGYRTSLPAKAMLDAICYGNFPYYQDARERTHAEVLAVFDSAILACGETL